MTATNRADYSQLCFAYTEATYARLCKSLYLSGERGGHSSGYLFRLRWPDGTLWPVPGCPKLTAHLIRPRRPPRHGASQFLRPTTAWTSSPSASAGGRPAPRAGREILGQMLRRSTRPVSRCSAGADFGDSILSSWIPGTWTWPAACRTLLSCAVLWLKSTGDSARRWPGRTKLHSHQPTAYQVRRTGRACQGRLLAI